MKSFTYERATDAASAIKVVAETPGARFLAGGTNLLDLMKLEIEQPTHLVDVSRLPLARIEDAPDGGLILGAMATNSQAAADLRVRSRYPALAQAILSGGSAQLRNKASLGGNLLQRTRCAYFYDPAKPCNKRRPGSGCSALEGLNRNSAIFGASEHCIATHPSDMAVALSALDARVTITSADGSTRSQPLDEIHHLPGATPDVETSLAPGDLVTSVHLPPPPPGGQVYLKARDRASYAGGLASVAVAGDRIALGAVALKPWRAQAAEQALAQGASPAEAAQAEIDRAQVRGKNAFKLALVARMVVQGLEETRQERPA